MTEASFWQQAMQPLLKVICRKNLLLSEMPSHHWPTKCIPTQPKLSIFEREFSAKNFVFKEIGHIFLGNPKPVIKLTDNKSVTQFF